MASAPLGRVFAASGGGAVVTRTTPLDLWPAGDVGQTRMTLARAHPLLDRGRIEVGRLGRVLLNGSFESQYWWKAPALSRVGAAVFIDVARTMRRDLGEQSMTDVDVGAGVGVSSLLVPGRFRLDYAHGLRDGADAITLRYVAPAW
jgi:hypothetical protein